jgi:hypothetical protein
MKRLLTLLTLIAVLASCNVNPKPAYATRKGKKRQKYYNDIQFGGKRPSEMKAPPK